MGRRKYRRLRVRKPEGGVEFPLPATIVDMLKMRVAHERGM